MQSAYHRLRFDDARIRVLDLSRLRTILLKSKMGPILIIVMHVFREYALEMSLIENDGVIETISSNRTDNSLDIWALPGRSSCNQNLFDSQCNNTLSELTAIFLISIPNHVTWRGIPGESFDDLLSGPECSG